MFCFLFCLVFEIIAVQNAHCHSNHTAAVTKRNTVCTSPALTCASEAGWQKLFGQLPGVCNCYQYGGPRYAPAPSPAGPSSSATPSAGAAPVGFSVCGEDGQEREAAGEAEGPSMSRLVMAPQLVDAALNQRKNSVCRR